MINTRPVSDLRNNFPEIEELVKDKGEPVCLTKNGVGSMVLLSIERYSDLVDGIEKKLDEADEAAAGSNVRYTSSEVFQRVRERIHV